MFKIDCKLFWYYCLIIFMFLGSNFSLASLSSQIMSISDPASIKIEIASDSMHATSGAWIFSGYVSTEIQDEYYYFFELKRKDKEVFARAFLVNLQNKQLILNESYSGLLDNNKTTQWQAGKFFLNFNAINDSWIFGVKKQNTKGFNFKIDMLGAHNKQQQDLRTGLVFTIEKTNNLNGHLQNNGLEEFVTANKTRFLKIWESEPQQISHLLTNVICDFKNGSSLFAVQLQENDAIRGALASMENEYGSSVPVSQFVHIIKKNENDWQIQVPYPRLILNLNNLLPQDNSDHLIAGLILGKNLGFCIINKELY